MKKQSLFVQILSALALAFLAVNAFAPVTSVFAQGVCDPSTTVNCWIVDEANRIVTWDGPVDGSADIWQGSEYILHLVRSGWKAVVPGWQVPGVMEICVGNVTDSNGKTQVASKDNCDGVLVEVPAGTVVVTESTGSSGGFRLKPAYGYGYRAESDDTYAPYAPQPDPYVPDGPYYVEPDLPNTFPWMNEDWFTGSAIALFFLGLLWSGLCAFVAFFRFSDRFGFVWGLLAGFLAGFFASWPCIGFPFLPIIIWAATRKPKSVVPAPAAVAASEPLPPAS